MSTAGRQAYRRRLRPVTALNQFLVEILYPSRGMTVKQMVRILRRRYKVVCSPRDVEAVLRAGRFRKLQPRFPFLWRSTRWVSAPAVIDDDSGYSGAHVSSGPVRPMASGSAAAELTFGEDEPPADVIGRIA